MKPLADYLTVQLDVVPSETKLESGIVVPASTNHDPLRYGRVLACGAKVEGVQEEQRVAFFRQSGHDLANGVRLLREDQLVGIVE